MYKAIMTVAATAIILLALDAYAQDDKVKYCKNATTGEIITVEASMPCPLPTHEI